MKKKNPVLPAGEDEIIVEGAYQNNLKKINVRIPLGKITVVTGVSGSGKSSLAFDTVYAEGQRRYVETFSAYTRQFLERMDKPKADRIIGIPPAIAIDQTNPVRTSRSTVGTMTELNDHLKLLFARGATLYCRDCGKPVGRDTPESVLRSIETEWAESGPAILISFDVPVTGKATEESLKDVLSAQGYTRFLRETPDSLEVVQDRLTLAPENRSRIIEDLETAFRFGKGRLSVRLLGADRKTLRARRRFSEDFHCADCDIHYEDPQPNLFSFNSPIGACSRCRGFGRTIGIDYDLVIPDTAKSLAEGAVKPWQTESYSECRQDLLKFAKKRGIPTNIPWKDLSEDIRGWVIEGEGPWEDGTWYGVRRFFDWLETKSYKMHIRVLLSKYRTYLSCPDCGGARLKSEALHWRVGGPRESGGLSIHDIMLLPLGRCLDFFSGLSLPGDSEEALSLVLEGVLTRLRYLVDVGLSYLTLDRQSRTLSGGEVQRINLTTALGTSLVNTLFVLDEPSIGLHSRDIGRLIRVLHRLRDAGNTLLIVEHDPELIAAADHILDMGPGPGENGGTLVFAGSLPEMLTARGSLTAEYLRGEKRVSPAGGTAGRKESHNRDKDNRVLSVRGAEEHNLKNINVDIPLGRFVCITGVSGSGKSTLVEDVLYRALRRLKGLPADAPGKHREIAGQELIDEAILVNQSPIGRTARSNPAGYVGALDPIRKIFAAAPLAKERGYTPGTFSFNSGKGRCPGCGGKGFEHIEMQFLSDVYLRCPDCDGKRYRPDVLEVRIEGGGAGSRSIADILDMTVSEACGFFGDRPEVLRVLDHLRAAGLGYLRLGQPLPTLSGGEAQRLKLAGRLAETMGKKKTDILFLLDEPTTGLHFDDISVLLRVFRRIIGEGHSLVVIEHNLDVIAAADTVIDLGPEGGAEGGYLVACGRPRDLAENPESRTGTALSRYFEKFDDGNTGFLAEPPADGPYRADVTDRADPKKNEIRITGAREHNLKNISLSVPRDTLTVITGVSGSGKSTVAFDILFAEGQRRYLESLNAYARQFVEPVSRADFDDVSGVPPTVAIEQRTSRGGRKSTVATVTEIYHFLRLLFVKLGLQYCPSCGIAIEPQSPESILGRLLSDYRDRTVTLLAPLVSARKGLYKELAGWAAGKGYERLRVDGLYIPSADWPRLARYKEHSIELPLCAVKVTPALEKKLREELDSALDLGKGVVHIEPEEEPEKTKIFSTLRACPSCGNSFPELDPRLFSYNSKHGWCPRCYGTGLLLPGFDAEQTGEEIWWNAWYEGTEVPCPDCGGQRLRPEALAVRFDGRSLSDITAFSVTQAKEYFWNLVLLGRQAEIARDILAELRSRLGFLEEVGLPYLTLDRSAPSLSGGESRRIRLASQLGSNLRGICYILDEPTIGLHARDNDMLLSTLKKLKNKGNTLVVVEHDEETIRQADHVIDLGPGGGVGGGQVLVSGPLNEIIRHPVSLTARFLREPIKHPLRTFRRPVVTAEQDTETHESASRIIIQKASLHNLKNIDVIFPLGRLVCVTGVSGSGKSTLLRDILYRNLKELLASGPVRGSGSVFSANSPRSGFKPFGCSGIEGWEGISRVLEVDQTPIGKTPRSCPATYVGFWDDIRRTFAETPEAKMRGYTPGRFSFNVSGGRCGACEGQGVKKIEMSFLPDVTVGCDVCGGDRFDEETREIRFKGKTVGDILRLSVEEALDVFGFHPRVRHSLQLLYDVGLGYLGLGRRSPSLSGGEAQRIKLVTELAKMRTGGALYILDEPTLGLHMADVERLLGVLYRLVDAGNTVILIEHNLDMAAEADWIIDLGPEGGEGGGRITDQGTPEDIAAGTSHTARYLRKFLQNRVGPGRSGSRSFSLG